MKNTRKDIAIAFFFLISCSVLAWFLLFLSPTLGDGKQLYKVRFSNVDQVNEGTWVTFAGHPVGQVKEIRRLLRTDQLAVDDWGRFYLYELLLRLDSSVDIHDSDEIFVRTAGLLGERFIEIVPRRIAGKTSRRISKDEVIYAESQSSMEETFDDVSSLVGKARQIVEKFSAIVDEDGQQLHETISSLKNSIKQLEKSSLLPSLEEGADSLQHQLKELRLGAFAQHLVSTAENLHTTTENMRVLMGQAGMGEGNVGKFFLDDNLYQQGVIALNKLSTLLDDVNHYGVLFHLDKGWQRQRLKYANRMADLNTVEAFQDSFEDEIARATTSISRLEKLAQGLEEKGADSKASKRSLNELLHRIEALQADLKQQLRLTP